MSEVSKRHSGLFDLLHDVVIDYGRDEREWLVPVGEAEYALKCIEEQLETAERERDSLAARLRAQGYNVTEILAFDASSPAGSPHSIDSQLTEEDFEIIAEDSSPAKEPHS